MTNERSINGDRVCFSGYEWCPGPDGTDKNGEPFNGKCEACHADRHPDVPRTLSEPIMRIWNGYDDFDTFDYVAFVLEQNAEELRDAENFEDAKTELADQAICALRMLSEMGYHPEHTVLERLSSRMENQQEQIIQTYKNQYSPNDASRGENND